MCKKIKTEIIYLEKLTSIWNICAHIFIQMLSKS